jgi:N-acyl-D-amino-acid deacylase
LDPCRILYVEPLRVPTGIDYVFVNGELVVEKGRQSGARPGKVVRK